MQIVSNRAFIIGGFMTGNTLRCIESWFPEWSHAFFQNYFNVLWLEYIFSFCLELAWGFWYSVRCYTFSYWRQSLLFLFLDALLLELRLLLFLLAYILVSMKFCPFFSWIWITILLVCRKERTNHRLVLFHLLQLF